MNSFFICVIYNKSVALRKYMGKKVEENSNSAHIPLKENLLLTRLNVLHKIRYNKKNKI